MSERKSYFVYSASGSAVGGILTSPAPLTIPTQAMASLSPSGGYGSATVENFGIDGLLTVRKGTATVQGDPHRTEVTVTLEDVNIKDVVTVRQLALHLVSYSPRGAAEASMSPVGSFIEGLRVRGKDISLPSSVNVFDRYPTFRDLAEAYRNGSLQGLIYGPGILGGYCDSPTLEGCQSIVGTVNATIYNLDGYNCGLPVVNGGLRVEGFGTLHLGSFEISRFARRLTMLRIELGCDTEGSLNLGDGSGNGHWDPPN